MKGNWIALSRKWYRSWGKRLLDIAVSSLALVLFSPLMLLLALVVRVVNGSPIVFVQRRPGLNERLFEMFKFRSMTNARLPNGEYQPDHLRVTPLGKFLRTSSLDELPELWNVLKGEMSLVGPRPLLADYMPFYSPEQRRRHTVRPGMTGLAQTNGRNQTTWAERLAWDIRYIENYGFWLDCRILARTLFIVFQSDGGIAAVDALGRFTGSSEQVSSGAEQPSAEVACE